MIYRECNSSQFASEFSKCGRGDQFSYEALCALYDYLEELYSSDDYELDVIELCCNYTEQAIDDLPCDYSGLEDDMSREQLLEWLGEHTSVVWNDGERVLYQQF